MSRASTSVPFVAREEQVALLEAAARRAAAGRATTALVSGDAGVGKSRLVAAATARAAEGGALVLVGHCVDFGGVGLPYLPFAEVLSALTTLAEDDDAVRLALGRHPVVRGLTGARAEVPASEDVGRLQLFDGVSTLLAELGAERLVVLVLEDLHWADQSTRELLRFLVSRSGSAHLLVVGTYRADDLHRRHPLRPLLAELVRHPSVERVEVEPFTEPELRRFAAAVAGDDVAESRLRTVLRRSEGNAYFAEELLEAGDDVRLPGSLADVVTARVELLTPAAQHLVRAAAVAGRRVTEPLLRAVVALEPPGDGAADLDVALRDAATHRVLEPDAVDRWAFRHALLAEAVYADLLPGERTRLHRAYARAISGDGALGSAAELAHHAVAGHDLPGALSASWSAADEAHRRVAPAEALRHLETVIDLWESVPDAAERVGADLVTTSLRAAEVADHSGELTRAVALARLAVREASGRGDPVVESGARRELARFLAGVEDPGVLPEAARAVELLVGTSTRVPEGEPTSPLLLAAAMLARAHMYADADDDARRWARWTLAGARDRGLPGVEADALTTLAVLEEDVDSRLPLLEQARDTARAAGDLGTELRSLFNLSAVEFYRGDVAAALVRTRAGQQRAAATGTTWSLWGIQMRVTEVIGAYLVGDWPGSRRAAALVGDTPPDLVAALLTAASLYERVGRGDPSAADAAEALRPAWSMDGQIALIAGGCLADALAWAGDAEQSVAEAREVLEHLARTWDDFFLGGIWLSALALSATADLAARRDADPGALARDADRLLAHAVETARRGRPRAGVLGPEGRAWLTRVHAEHARATGRDGVAAWRSAVEAFADWYPYEEARSRWRLAEALLAVGDRDGAAEQLAAAVATADSLGAAPLRAALADLGRRGRLGTAGGAGTPSALLTSREAEVLALVAEGLTNRVVGQRLFISDKTVSVHLSNVMAKLGASSRTEAVTLAHRRGLLPA